MHGMYNCRCILIMQTDSAIYNTWCKTPYNWLSREFVTVFVMEYCHAPFAECFHWNLPTSWIVWIRRLAFLPSKNYNKHHSLTKPVILITSWEPGMLPLLCIKQTERIIINCFCKCNGPLARYIKLRVRKRRECRERFPRHCGLAIPTWSTARASRTCRNACRDR